MIRRGEKDCGLQGMGDVLMRGKLLSVVERDGVHEVRNRFEAAHGCFLGCAPPLRPPLTTVSPSQSPRRVLRATIAGRSEMSILLGIRPRPAFLPARLL